MDRGLRVLVTGFEPFDGAPSNPSGEVALLLDGRRVGPSAKIIGACLPVLWDSAAEILTRRIAEHRPRVVVCLGQAAGHFRVEQVATDKRTDRSDNSGRAPGARAAGRQIETALPFGAIERALIEEVGEDFVEASSDAGGFLCEEVFFALMRIYVEPPRTILRAGFIHVPSGLFVPSVLSKAKLEQAVLRAISVTVTDLRDDELY